MASYQKNHINFNMRELKIIPEEKDLDSVKPKLTIKAFIILVQEARMLGNLIRRGGGRERRVAPVFILYIFQINYL